MKTSKIKVKAIISIFIILSILTANSLSLVSSAYGADIGNCDGSVTLIRNINSGKYIDLPNGTVANGKQVQLYEGNGSTSQRWDIRKEGNGYYSIRSAINTQYLLALQNDKDVNGANIVLKYVPNGSTVPDSALFLL